MNYETLGRFIADVWGGVVAYSPKLLAAAVLLLIGWGVALALRWVVIRAVSRYARRAPEGKVERAVKDTGIDRAAAGAIGEVLFWAVFLLFVAAAGQVLGLIVLTSALSRLAQHLPNVLAAMLVVFAGIVLAKLSRVAIAGTAGRAGLAQGELLGQIARVLILIVAAVIALDQIGIDSALPILLLGIVLGTVIGGAALAFGMGARDAVRGFVAASELQRTYRPGDHVRVGDVQGRIISFTRTAVLLDTAEGRARVPAADLDARVSFLVDTDGL